MNDMNRRHLLAGGAALAAAWTWPAAAQTIKGTVKLVVGYPPGGPADVLARALAEPLKAALGTLVLVDNRPGAGGRVAAEQVRHAPPDGTTLLVTPASVLTMAPHLYKSVRYDIKDFLPLLPLARLDLGLEVDLDRRQVSPLDEGGDGCADLAAVRGARDPPDADRLQESRAVAAALDQGEDRFPRQQVVEQLHGVRVLGPVAGRLHHQEGIGSGKCIEDLAVGHGAPDLDQARNAPSSRLLVGQVADEHSPEVGLGEDAVSGQVAKSLEEGAKIVLPVDRAGVTQAKAGIASPWRAAHVRQVGRVETVAHHHHVLAHEVVPRREMLGHRLRDGDDLGGLAHDATLEPDADRSVQPRGREQPRISDPQVPEVEHQRHTGLPRQTLADEKVGCRTMGGEDGVVAMAP